ncbi:hypothetical protein [Gemmata sp.]|uniref:hypothetical protein n=1 Tax=Gemmata sp. TaxID=1914242 RepID=UPI003F723A92
MPPFTERDAANLPPEQAVALLRVLDLQAEWDGLLADKGPGLAALRSRQKANDVLQAALRAYAGAYGRIALPEPTQAMPNRLSAWCRVLRIVFQRAEGVRAPHLMAKVYRLGTRVAAKTGKEPAAHDENLDTVIAWCEKLVQPLFRKQEDAA